MKIYRSVALRLLFICLFFLLFCAQHSQAKAKKEQSTKSKTPPAASQEMIAKIKSALTAKPWTVYVIYQEMVKGQMVSSVETDILTFTPDSVLSGNLALQGFSKGGSGYNVKIDAQGAYVWESVQLHENQADIAVLRGELKDGLMRGVVIYQPQGKPGRALNFTTVRPE